MRCKQGGKDETSSTPKKFWSTVEYDRSTSGVQIDYALPESRIFLFGCERLGICGSKKAEPEQEPL